MAEQHGRGGPLGAAPADSALNLRTVLAAGGLVVCLGLGLAALLTVDGTPGLLAGAALLVLAAAAAVDLVVLAVRRRDRAEHERREHGQEEDHSLFE